MANKKKAKAKVGRPKKVKEVEVIHKVQFRTTSDPTGWTSLVQGESDTPDLSELHSIIKFCLLLIEKTAGFEAEQSLFEIFKDIKAERKDRHKFILDDTSDWGIKDHFKIQTGNFKRYK